MMRGSTQTEKGKTRSAVVVTHLCLFRLPLSSSREVFVMMHKAELTDALAVGEARTATRACTGDRPRGTDDSEPERHPKRKNKRRKTSVHEDEG